MDREKTARVIHDVTRYVVDAATGCWNWSGAKLRTGHAMVRVANRLWLAHRLFYEFLIGPIAAGLLAHHVCENPSCVNPGHIALVTPAEHAAIHAELHGKLNHEKAREIRRLWRETSLTQGEIAARYVVHHSTISRVVRNESWRSPEMFVALPRAA